MKQIYFLLSSFLVLASCATQSDKAAQDGERLIKEQDSQAKYESIIEKYSAGDTEYNGFYNHFGFHASIFNSQMIDARVQRQADVYMWDEKKLSEEKDKAYKDAADSTEVILSFFTPDRHDDNLATDKSIWRVLLDIDNKRYVGKIKKIKKNNSEMISLYPYHTRWNSLYSVVFQIPVSKSEVQESRLTITGPLGARTVQLPKVIKN